MSFLQVIIRTHVPHFLTSLCIPVQATIIPIAQISVNSIFLITGPFLAPDGIGNLHMPLVIPLVESEEAEQEEDEEG